MYTDTDTSNAKSRRKKKNKRKRENEKNSTDTTSVEIVNENASTPASASKKKKSKNVNCPSQNLPKLSGTNSSPKETPAGKKSKKKKGKKAENGHSPKNINQQNSKDEDNINFLPNPFATESSNGGSEETISKGQKKKNKRKKSLVQTFNDETNGFEMSPSKKPHLQISTQSTSASKNGTISEKELKKKAGKDWDLSLRAMKETELFDVDKMDDSCEHAKSLLEWLIAPMKLDTFMSEYWEKKPLLAKRFDQCPGYYDWMRISSAKVDNILRTNVLKYGKNVDVTSFKNDIRETISDDLEGRLTFKNTMMCLSSFFFAQLKNNLFVLEYLC